MKTKIIAATGDTEIEQQVNSFIMGKNVVDIKLTEWVSYQHQTGGYTCFITYEDSPPTRQTQVKIIGTIGEIELEQKINLFIADKTVVDIKFTEWAEYESQTGGYTALIIYVTHRGSFNPQTTKQANPKIQNAAQFDVL